jgi:D-alanyl-D-alanine carboxypeptidase
VIYDRSSKTALFGRMEKERREIASLTKIMNFYTVLNLIDRKGISINTKIIIDEEAA